jgi:hypothetical protein
MTTELVEIDSRVMKGSVLSIQDFDPQVDFEVFERSYIAEFNPIYVSCKVPMERVNETHILEDTGFRLIESQIRLTIKLRRPFDVSAFPFDFEQVTREEDLDAVLDIAGTTFTNDRFSIDRSIDRCVSGARFREYTRQSFYVPNEAVYRMVDRDSGLTVAFKTHRYNSDTEVLFLLAGVHPDFKNLGLGLINEHFELNELIRKGIKRGITHISAVNYPVLNYALGNLGFKSLTTFAVFRKVYLDGR